MKAYGKFTHLQTKGKRKQDKGQTVKATFDNRHWSKRQKKKKEVPSSTYFPVSDYRMTCTFLGPLKSASFLPIR
jgi:hypothetical protein